MASLQSSTLLLSSSSLRGSSRRTRAAIQIPKLPKLRISVPNVPKTTSTSIKLVEELCLNETTIARESSFTSAKDTVTAQLYAILEAVADRVEMHNNIREQRDNWNSLLLNSINMMTLTAATMAGFAATNGAVGSPLLGLKLSSTLLFSAATGMLVMVNKIQPSQLAEEQRNAARLFKQLQSHVQSLLTLGVPSQRDVDVAMQKVLALDKAYPLPLLGVMLEKFPATFEPASWWPSDDQSKMKNKKPHFEEKQHSINGWSDQLEAEMKEIIEIIKRKDAEDYVRLGSLFLKINKTLAISGPLLTGIAALSSAFVGDGSWAGIVAVAAGALATCVNAFEHGCQIGMVFEMYRNSAGFFKLLEDSIKATLDEKDWEKRENGEVYEMKVALQLGRSLSQLRELATKSAASRAEGISMDEFASKLF